MGHPLVGHVPGGAWPGGRDLQCRHCRLCEGTAVAACADRARQHAAMGSSARRGLIPRGRLRVQPERGVASRDRGAGPRAARRPRRQRDVQHRDDGLRQCRGLEHGRGHALRHRGVPHAAEQALGVGHPLGLHGLPGASRGCDHALQPRPLLHTRRANLRHQEEFHPEDGVHKAVGGYFCRCPLRYGCASWLSGPGYRLVRETDHPGHVVCLRASRGPDHLPDTQVRGRRGPRHRHRLGRRTGHAAAQLAAGPRRGVPPVVVHGLQYLPQRDPLPQQAHPVAWHHAVARKGRHAVLPLLLWWSAVLQARLLAPIEVHATGVLHGCHDWLRPGRRELLRERFLQGERGGQELRHPLRERRGG
mmetsp:Transcript_44096/g.127516  ORF Transcript_44096/g.127516 Transcript_44096/m.127516 type:complete len:361 (-) Transcript_44096:365-1447(-)